MPEATKTSKPSTSTPSSEHPEPGPFVVSDAPAPTPFVPPVQPVTPSEGPAVKASDGMRSTAELDKSAPAPALDTTKDAPETKEEKEARERNEAHRAATAISDSLHENDAQRQARLDALSGKKKEETAAVARVLRAIAPDGNVLRAESWPLKRDPTEAEKEAFLRGTRGASKVDVAEKQ